MFILVAILNVAIFLVMTFLYIFVFPLLPFVG